ncbi:MAG: ArsR/SmtB family transcription factor [Lachnospirales bacterium]
MNDLSNSLKSLSLSLDNESMDNIEIIGKALASKDRLRIIDLLRVHWQLPMTNISTALDLPISTVYSHIKQLESAGIVFTETRKGIRGTSRICSCTVRDINISMAMENTKLESKIITSELPIGAYSNCEIEPTCGMCNKDQIIGTFNNIKTFYSKERLNAQLIWFRNGFLEYKFPNNINSNITLQNIQFNLELCSEARGSNPNWPSHISFYINDIYVGNYTSPGDFGDRKGVYTPEFWEIGNSQYGLLTTISVSECGCYVNNNLINKSINIFSLTLNSKPYITFKISVDDSKIIGGINIFGKHFGDYKQDINMNLFY